MPLDQSPLTQIAMVSRNDYGSKLLRQQRDSIEREIESCKARCEEEDTSGNVAMLKQVLAKYFIELGQVCRCADRSLQYSASVCN